VVPNPSTRSPRRPSAGPARQSLRLIQGSFSRRRADRRAPWLGTLHRLADGTLAGLGVSLVALTGLSLHWQTRWADSFAQLQAAQTLEHRLQESSALLEQHHLGAARRTNVLVPTSSSRLIHLPAPDTQVRPPSLSRTALAVAAGSLRQIPVGY